MQVFHKLECVACCFGPTVVTVGNFDGVHRDHSQVLKTLCGGPGNRAEKQ